MPRPFVRHTKTCVSCGAPVPEAQLPPYRGHRPDCALVADWMSPEHIGPNRRPRNLNRTQLAAWDAAHRTGTRQIVKTGGRWWGCDRRGRYAWGSQRQDVITQLAGMDEYADRVAPRGLHPDVDYGYDPPRGYRDDTSQYEPGLLHDPHAVRRYRRPVKPHAPRPTPIRHRRGPKVPF